MAPRRNTPWLLPLRAAAVALLLGSTGWAATPMIALPPGESARDWEGALSRHGLGAGPGGIEVAVAGDGWHLLVRTNGGARQAVVPTPTSDAGREAVAALAAALLAPSPSLPPIRPAPVAPAPPPSTPPSVSAGSPAPPSRPPAVRKSTPAPKAPTARTQPAALPDSPLPEVSPDSPPAPRTGASSPDLVLPDLTPITATALSAAPPPATGISAPMVVEASSGPSLRPRLSLAVRGTSRIHAGLGTTFGGSGDLRLRLGRAWASVGGGTATAAPLAEGIGSLGASRLGGQVGLAASDTPRVRLDLGIGAGAQAWRVQDLDGDRTSWAADAEASATLTVTVWGPLALDVGAAALYDFQQIEVLGSAEAPAPVVVEPFLGIRLSP